MNQMYRAAIYVRLSKEDKETLESNSIHNQKDLIYSFAFKQPDILICSERIDDGYTGTNFVKVR